MKNKKLLLVATAAMGVVAIGIAGVGTAAWYTADANATISKGTSTGGSLSTEASSISAGSYTINFTVSVADATLELSHVATSSEASSGVNGIAAANLSQGDLIYGVVSNGTANMKKCESVSNYVTSWSATAAWASAPTNPADVAYLSSGLKFTATLTATAQAYLLGSSAVSGLQNYETGTVDFTISYADSTWTFTPSNYTHQYVHVEPSQLGGTPEDGTTGSLAITAVSALTSAA